MRSSTAGSRSFSVALVFAAHAIAALVLTASVSAQPFDAWLASAPGYPTTHGYIEVPHSASLNPTTAMTVEAWVLDNVSDGPVAADCRSIAGKDFQDTWWIGICNEGGFRSLRSSMKGLLFTGGRIAVGQWTHVAVTLTTSQRRHYVNGELTGVENFVPLPLGTNSDPMRIGSDFGFPRSPNGAIDEFRLWNVARTEAQIRANLNLRIETAQPGLVGVWSLSGNGDNVVGPQDGALVGTGATFLIGAVASDCGPQTTTALCLVDRFQVTAKYRTGPQTNPEGIAQTIPCAGALCENSGIFWFFQNNNWELMVKVLNGCGPTQHWWVFNAGLTNQFFRLVVTDVTKAETKIYFNYFGPPAAAITDVLALDVCP